MLSRDESVRTELQRCEASLAELISTESGVLEPLHTGVVPELNQIPDIKALLFDIYGTLLISAGGEVGSSSDTILGSEGTLPFFHAARSAGFQTKLPPEQFNRKLEELYSGAIQEIHAHEKKRGNTAPEVDILSIWNRILSKVVKEGDAEGTVDAHTLIFTSLRYELRTNSVWPMPGVLELLSLLRMKKYRIGIVSNAQFYTPLILEALFSRELKSLGFEGDLIQWSYLLGSAKPSPHIFKEVLSRLEDRGITPGEVLYLGNDMLNDIYTARECGCRTCLFAGDRRSLRWRNENPRLQSCRPDAIINRLSQVPRLLGEVPVRTH